MNINELQEYYNSLVDQEVYQDNIKKQNNPEQKKLTYQTEYDGLDQQLFKNNIFKYNQYQEHYQLEKLPKIEQKPYKKVKKEKSWNIQIVEQKKIKMEKNNEKKLNKINHNLQNIVVKQIFSFLLYHKKSKSFIHRYFKNNEQKIQEYYWIVQNIKKKNPLYLSRTFLKGLVELNSDHLVIQLLNKLNKKQNTVKQYRRCFRTFINYYLNQIYVCHIFTSKRILHENKPLLLSKKRQIQQYMQQIYIRWFQFTS